jgi:hypothetical protein
MGYLHGDKIRNQSQWGAKISIPFVVWNDFWSWAEHIICSQVNSIPVNLCGPTKAAWMRLMVESYPTNYCIQMPPSPL